MQPDTHLERRMFPQLNVIHHDAWVEASWGNFSGIYINGHKQVFSRADAETARLSAIQFYRGKLIEFGEIEDLTIDGRPGWGWTEWWRLDNGGLDYVAYRAVVPYDTMSYALEFISGDPSLKIRPDSLRTVLSSFGIGVTQVNTPLLAILGGALLLALNMLRNRMAARADRQRTITLVKIPKKGAGGQGNLSIAESIARSLEEKDPPPSPGPPPTGPPGQQRPPRPPSE